MDQEINVFASIKEAIDAIKSRKMIIVVDDVDRENEGDFFMAAQFATPQHINMMITLGKGLVCVPLTANKAKALALPLMTEATSDSFRTAFTISVDHHTSTTGISADERSTTIQALANKDAKPEHFKRPGHIFPLIGKEGGVLVRPGHTEAAIDLCLLASVEPVGVIVEILNEDGTMARRQDLVRLAASLKMPIITIEALIQYIKEHTYAKD
jgi:3,4-dihydroxy 2-butanone 4-phosphate synthase/GTP cyclohydrolase II